MPSGGGPGLWNYNITYQNGTLYVTTALLKNTLDNVGQTYGTVASLPVRGSAKLVS